jgi:dihydroorotate dehydrogenase electron transfer subunit
LFQGKAPVIFNQEIMNGTNLIWVEAPEIADSAEPGQFAMIACGDGKERILRRPISIHNIQDNNAAFLFSVVGEGTGWLAKKQTGQMIDVAGPMGNHFSINPESRNLLIAAGGIGIAPLTYFAAEAVKKGYSVRMLIGARSKDCLVANNILPQDCGLFIVTEDGSEGDKGMITSILPQHADWADQIYLCGPLPMYKAVASHKRHFLQNKPTQVSLEVRMGCGLGFCYSCTIKTLKGLKQVCKDGPVFNFDEVIWEELN